MSDISAGSDVLNLGLDRNCYICVTQHSPLVLSYKLQNVRKPSWIDTGWWKLWNSGPSLSFFLKCGWVRWKKLWVGVRGDLVTCCLKYFLGLFTDPVDGERLVNCSSDVLCILLAKRTKFKHAWSFCRETV